MMRRMNGFSRASDGHAVLGGVDLQNLVAAANFPLPAYIYDLDGIGEEAAALVAAAGDKHVVAYAIKANSAGSIVRRIAEQGAGADLVSGGELLVALGCGIPPSKIFMSGVAKSDDELDAAISHGIRAIQAESVEELSRVAARARALKKPARISLRINPSVEIDSHAHVATGHDDAKFGVAIADVARAWETVDGSDGALLGVGVSTHVGSMLEEPSPYLESSHKVCDVAAARVKAGHALEFVDFGGGFGIDYGDGPVSRPGEFATAAIGLLAEYGLDDLGVVFEPGRALVGPYGVLVANVIQSKVSGSRRWLMVDAGMNDLLRPALYEAKHRIEPLAAAPAAEAWRVVGPVCESADDFGSHAIGAQPPDRVAIRDVGAYGFAMASEYNGRALATEVFLSGGKVVRVSTTPGRDAWVRGRLEA